MSIKNCTIIHFSEKQSRVSVARLRGCLTKKRGKILSLRRIF